MLLKGTLSFTTLPEILHSICVSSATGLLDLEQFSVQKRIYFEDGRITFAYSNQRKDSLGDVLLRNGVITLEQYLETSKSIQPGMRHGEILVKEGIITSRELHTAVNSQVRDVIFSLFSWTEGTFSFGKEEKRTETIKLATSSSNLILAGVMTISDWGIIERMIGGIDTTMESSPDFESKLAELKLSDQERDIARFSLGRTVRDILRFSLMNDFHSCRLLAGFVTIDLLRLRKTQQLFLEPVRDLESARLSRILFSFNRVFELICSTANEQVGPMAEKILLNYYNEIRNEEHTLLHNVTMGPGGRLDTDMIELNLINMEEENKAEHVYTVFSRIMDSFLKASRELMGEASTTVLEGQIRDVIRQMMRA